MSNRIRELLEDFASKLEAEMKRQLMTAIGASDMGLGSSSSRSSDKVTNAHGRGKGAKREAGELEALQDRFLAFVSKKPGLRNRADQQGVGDNDEGPAAARQEAAGRRTLEGQGSEALDDLRSSCWGHNGEASQERLRSTVSGW